jgi:hypothetical protein
MSGDRDRVILAEVIARCWQDQAFADELIRDPKTVLREAGMGIPEEKTVKVFRNTDKVTYLGLSHQMKPTEYATFANTHLPALLPLAPEHEIHLVQSTENYLPVIIPNPPSSFAGGELTDAELASVAGGGYLVEAANVATTANAAVEANAAAVQNVAGATEAVVAAEAAAVIAVVLI